ncbi:GNAT family N-acetyltransferase [Sporosarcina sp. ANT_H38]
MICCPGLLLTLKGVIEILIRKAEVEDAEGIAKVHVDSWRTTYKGIVPETFLENLSYEQRELTWKRGIKENNVYIAEDENGQVIGFSTGGKERTGKYEAYTGELYAIYILKEYQGKGIGQLLVQTVVEDLKVKNLNSMLIWAIEENPACRFYEMLGGKKMDTEEIEIAGKKLSEVAYGWGDITNY